MPLDGAARDLRRSECAAVASEKLAICQNSNPSCSYLYLVNCLVSSYGHSLSNSRKCDFLGLVDSSIQVILFEFDYFGQPATTITCSIMASL